MTKNAVVRVLLLSIFSVVVLIVPSSIHWIAIPDDSGVAVLSHVEHTATTTNFTRSSSTLFRDNQLGLDNTFSACLVVMDDNHRLLEWLAYHYHVLRLRYLIIAVDPRSRTSPMDVLHRWEPFMKIILWDDTRFVPEHRRNLPENATTDEKTRMHRARQSFFLSACSTAMKEANRSYVLLLDSDEYLTFNRPEGVTLSGGAPEDLRSIPAPSVSEEGSVLRVLTEARDTDTSLGKPCFPIYRALFNARESSEQERQSQVPSDYNATLFDTLRYRYCNDDAATSGGMGYTQLGKSVIDVSRIPISALRKPRKYFPNPHQILYPEYCANVHNIRDYFSFFRVNHYLGSWESYSYRDDARNGPGWRSKTAWEKTTRNMVDKADDTIRPWLKGFVDTMGTEKATYLLKDVGVIPFKEAR